MNPLQRLFELSGQGWISKAVAAAAELDLARLIAEGTTTAVALAAATGTDPDGLRILLETLAAEGVFAVDGDGRFANTEVSARLDERHPESMRYQCLLMTQLYDAAWHGIVPMLRHGGSGFERHYGRSLYEYLSAHPEHERIFHRAMADSTGPITLMLAERCDLSEIRTVVDVGGGNGTLLKKLLSRYPGMHGVCADRAEVCDAAAKELAESGDELKTRLEFQAADIFATLPSAADLYIVKNVLHDWNPESVRTILKVIRTAAGAPGARLMVIEQLSAEGTRPGHQLFKMIICEEGTELHSPEQMRELVEESGFTITQTFPLPSGHTVLDCMTV
jgi:C-methyltransferase